MKKVYYDREKAEGRKVAILLMENSPSTASDIFGAFYTGVWLGASAPFVCGYMQEYRATWAYTHHLTSGRSLALSVLLDEARKSVKQGDSK